MNNLHCKLIVNIINNKLLFRHINIWSKYFFSKSQKNHFKNVSYKHIKLNNETNIALCHRDKTISKLNSNNSLSNKIVGSWLLTCSGMVFVAVSLGGVTRLTESGLSMVRWKLLGEKIPVDENSWSTEFEEYKKYPEFKILNKDMTLDEFKRIWWMEYIHRMWGRFIGVLFFVPASYFWMKNMFHPIVKKRILILGILISCQGFMGWYMVKSGLENEFNGPSDVPRVSQYRLAAHLSLAFIIYSGLFNTALDHLTIVRDNKYINTFQQKIQSNVKQLRRFRLLTHSSIGLILLTAISGAFVAGLDAGLIYNTFPKMANKWIPEDIFFMKPLLKNVTENPTMVQFNHRILGMLTLIAASCISVMARKYKLYGRVSTAALVVLGTAYLQAALGIFTLLNTVPIHLAALHQSNSLVLLSALIWLSHEIKYIKKFSK